jgi:hypothetical protein
MRTMRLTRTAPLARFALALLPIAALVLEPVPAAAKRHWGSGFNVNVSEDARDCSDIRITADDEVARAEERATFDASTGVSLAAAQNGGLYVTGGTGSDIEVLICKAAIGDDAAEAQRRLDQITVTKDRASLSASGPSRRDSDWIAYLIVRAPKGAKLDLSMNNGPLSVSNAEGRFTIRGENGPVSLNDVGGEVTVDLENGPASLEGGSGSIRIRTRNGPISIDLEGGEWQGSGLEARASNGPLSLQIDEGYRGSVRVESDGHAPWSCKGPCRGASKDWDDDTRSVTFGEAPYKVKLSTENGPISIDRN